MSVDSSNEEPKQFVPLWRRRAGSPWIWLVALPREVRKTLRLASSPSSQLIEVVAEKYFAKDEIEALAQSE